MEHKQGGLEGYLKKKTVFTVKGMGLFKKRFVVLREGFMRYYKTEEDYRKTPELPKGVIELKSIRAVKVTQVDPRRWSRFSLGGQAKEGCQFEMHKPGRIYEWAADSPQDAAHWINEIIPLTKETSRDASVVFLDTLIQGLGEGGGGGAASDPLKEHVDLMTKGALFWNYHLASSASSSSSSAGVAGAAGTVGGTPSAASLSTGGNLLAPPSPSSLASSASSSPSSPPSTVSTPSSLDIMAISLSSSGSVSVGDGSSLSTSPALLSGSTPPTGGLPSSGSVGGGDAVPTRSRVFVFYNRNQGAAGCLYWNDHEDDRKESLERCLPLKSITDMYLGKQTPLLKTPLADDAAADHCFSLISKHTALNLEAQTPGTRTAWVRAVTQTLNKKGGTVKADSTSTSSSAVSGEHPVSRTPAASAVSAISPPNSPPAMLRAHSGGLDALPLLELGAAMGAPHSSSSMSFSLAGALTAPPSPSAASAGAAMHATATNNNNNNNSNPTEDGDEISELIRFMTTGAAFHRYTPQNAQTTPDAPVTDVARQRIFLYYDRKEGAAGSLRWCDDSGGESEGMRVEVPANVLPLKALTDLFMGKQTDVLKAAGATLPKECCFSLLSKLVALHLEADSSHTRQMWITAISKVLHAKGRVVRDDKRAQTAASAASAVTPSSPTSAGASSSSASASASASSSASSASSASASAATSSLPPAVLHAFNLLSAGQEFTLYYVTPASPALSSAHTPPSTLVKQLSSASLRSSSPARKPNSRSGSPERGASPNRDSPTAGTTTIAPATPLPVLHKRIRVYYDRNLSSAGALCWQDVNVAGAGDKSAANKGPSGDCLPLRAISDMYIGKQTPVFKASEAERVDKDKCLSLSTKDTSMDIEADSSATRNQWLDAICQVLNSLRV